MKRQNGPPAHSAFPLDRRRFLKSAAAAAALVPLPRTASGQAAFADVNDLLRQGMTQWKVPGVGYGIVRPGHVVAHSLGLRRAESPDRIGGNTLFQAASLSKSIAAVTALVLVERGTLALDTDVHAYLKTWKLAVPPFAEGHTVTLRRLLAMTGGINVPGYLGYHPGLPLPTLTQILDGAPPANSQAVRIIASPGTAESYSGGGYEIVQAVIENVTGQDFAHVARRLVLEPFRMSRSAFEQPLSAQRATDAATGHYLEGRAMDGAGNVFPELAAAGLWSTPNDLAKFLIALSNARLGYAGALLSPKTIDEMLTPVDGFHYALGGPVRGKGRNLVFMKRGHNVGFHSYMLIFPETGQGAVIMTNSENGDHLIEPFLRHVSEREGWPPWDRLAE